MTKTKKDKLLKKIKDLLDLSNDRNSTNEAETAAKKAQELILKYNIEEAEIHGSDPLSMEKCTYPLYKIQIGNEGTWDRTLFSTIAQFNFCKVILSKTYVEDSRKPQDILYILGESSNVELVIYLTEQLIERLRSIEKKFWGEYHGRDKRNTYRRGFLKGAVSGIYHQLREQQERFKDDSQTEGLILRKDAQLKEFVKEQFPELGKSRSATSSSRDGQIAGYKTGKNMSINQGVRGRGGTLQLGD